MAKTIGDEPENSGHDDDFKAVKLPSGAEFAVYKHEVPAYNRSFKQYMTDNDFQNASDLADLDSILMKELLVWRYAQWLSRELNYWDEPIEVDKTHAAMEKLSKQITSTKAKLRIDKDSRDKEKGTEDVANYIANLRYRAKHFGIKRNKEFHEIFEIFHELRGKIELHDRCDDIERKEIKANLSDIRDWLVEVAYPRFDEIDRKFRQEGFQDEISNGVERNALDGGPQSMWVRSQ